MVRVAAAVVVSVYFGLSLSLTRRCVKESTIIIIIISSAQSVFVADRVKALPKVHPADHSGLGILVDGLLLLLLPLLLTLLFVCSFRRYAELTL